MIREERRKKQRKGEIRRRKDKIRKEVKRKACRERSIERK